MPWPSARARAALLLVGATLALLPLAAHPVGPTVSFLPAILAIVACFDVMSVYLLAGEFRDTGDRRILAMSCCFVWSLVAMTGYSLAFPGVISDHPPLAITPSMAPWFYITWHGAFPALLGLAWVPWPRAWSPVSGKERRVAEARLATLAAAVVAAMVVALLAALAHQLPVLIHGTDTSQMTRLTAPVTLPLAAAALVLALRGTKGRSGPERWTVVVVLVCLCDLVLTYAASHRYSLGWYAGRSLTMVAAGIVLVAMLATLRRAKSQAEHDAMVDSLTGLANRRRGYRDLHLLIDVARLAGSPLSVISFDIDHFKTINDQFGHDAGDQVLSALGAELGAWVRQSDLAARVGGEEFLVVLPGADLAGAMLTAEKIRLNVQRQVWAGLAVTVSLGVATLHPDGDDASALLMRADTALYGAKDAGRNRVAAEVAPEAGAAEALLAGPVG